MIVIRTAEEMARALHTPPDSELKHILQTHWNWLTEWDDLALEDLALFIIAQVRDTPDQVNAAAGTQLIADSRFALLPEVVERSARWATVSFVLSDDGYGIVLLVEMATGTDRGFFDALDALAADNVNLCPAESPATTAEGASSKTDPSSIA